MAVLFGQELIALASGMFCPLTLSGSQALQEVVTDVLRARGEPGLSSRG